MLAALDNDPERWDLSSLKVAIHAAAPCPIEIKERMLKWWGPVVHEYYAGTENNGFCWIGPEEWLSHKGSVGKSLLGTLHIVDDEGRELPPSEVGGVYFEGNCSMGAKNAPGGQQATKPATAQAAPEMRQQTAQSGGSGRTS